MRVRKGFTLVEALFAIFLVAICAAIVAATTPIASMSRVKAESMNKATGIAQKELESIRGAGFANCTASALVSAGLLDSTNVVAPNTYSFTNSDLLKFDNAAKVLPNGTGTVKLEQLNIDLVRVTVTVTWMERTRQRQISIGTLIANI